MYFRDVTTNHDSSGVEKGCGCAPHWDGPQGECAWCVAAERESCEAGAAIREALEGRANWSPEDDFDDYHNAADLGGY